MFLPEKIFAQLEKNKTVFQALLSDVDAQQQTWKPSPKKWCLLEVVCHLYDEEREDFRARLQHVLEQPGNPLPPIDPVGWVTARKYMQQDYEQQLNAFLRERDNSVRWLHGLTDPHWENAYQHRQFGPMNGKLFLTNWLAHDYLHIRQILSLRHGYLHVDTGENLKYAGDW